ncbi:MAG: ribonucleotide-diphosphate reductase subunit beta [Candidatus Roizmanbacteria bacterium]
MTQNHPERLSLFPLQPYDREPWEYYQKQEEASWAVSEVNLKDDVVDWEEMSPDFKAVFEMLMAFFAVSDRLIVLNIQDLQHRIGRHEMARSCFLTSQERIECVHQHMYAIFISSIIPSPSRRAELYDAVKTFPSIAKKTAWMRSYLGHEDIRVAILANACGEGIGFSNAFGIALLPKTMSGKMFGWCYGNEKVMADEFLHFSHCCSWYREFSPLSQDTFNAVVTSAVDVELAFVKDILGDKKFPGLDAEKLSLYTFYIADLLCNMCGHPPIYNVTENPLNYMVLTGLKGKTNFFERTVGEYKKLSADNVNQALVLDFTKLV